MARVAERSEVERALSHHSLRSPEVAGRVLAHSGLAPPDTVYEIGPGSGMLTSAIAARVRRVVAVEHDRAAWAALRGNYATVRGVDVVLGDLLTYPLPGQGSYRVVGNIPFSRTSSIMRRLLALPNPPLECVLVMQREAALRWSGAVSESEVSIVAKIRFAFEVRSALRRRDFVPPPRVECVVLGIVPKRTPDLSGAEARAFRAFVARGFGQGRPSLRRNLGEWIAAKPFADFAAENAVRADAAPGELSYAQWLALFRRSRQRAGWCGTQGARMTAPGARR